jgi:hypothetical protein
MENTSHTEVAVLIEDAPVKNRSAMRDEITAWLHFPGKRHRALQAFGLPEVLIAGEKR